MNEARPTEDSVARLKRAFHSTLIAVSDRLDQPYPDDPRWTPWTLYVRPMIDRVDTGIDGLTAERDGAKARAVAAEARLAAVDRTLDSASTYGLPNSITDVDEALKWTVAVVRAALTSKEQSRVD